MDNASKEIKEYGMIKMFLPEAGTFERAVPYRLLKSGYLLWIPQSVLSVLHFLQLGRSKKQNKGQRT